MFFKDDYDHMISRSRGDERVVGKVNLQLGLAAVIFLLGAVGVILLLSMGEGLWALGVGILAAALFVLTLWDPLKVLKRHSRRDPGVYNPESRE